MNRFFAIVALIASPLVAAVPQANNVVLPVNAAPQLLVPAGGSTAGAGGTFFRSDITLINFGSTDQRVQLRWLPQAGAGTPMTTEITIPALNIIRSEDFVTNYIGVQGLGSILITGLTSTGAIDTNAKLYASSRIWTPQPGTSGTTSQTLDVIPPSSTALTNAAIFGLRRDQRYRANVGIVNLDPTSAATFVISVPTQAVPATENYSVTIPPMSMQQVSLAQSIAILNQINITRASSTAVAWTAYGSSIDNVTGDSWTELALPGQ
jgi:hypothetical protein